MAEAGKIIFAGDLEVGSTSEPSSDLERNFSIVDRSLERMEDGPNNYEQIVDIDRWASSLARLLDDVPQYICSPGHPGRISKIPQNIREIDVKSYEPYFISIGPYHHGKPKVQAMERRKWMALKCVLGCKSELILKDYLKEIKRMEPLVRTFYSDVQLGSEKFVEMLLLDSLYIVTTFCGMPNKQGSITHMDPRMEYVLDTDDMNERGDRESEDTIPLDDNENVQMLARADEPNDELSGGDGSMTRLFSLLFEHDLFLPENQLPFFLLQKVFALTYGCSELLFIGVMKDRVSLLLPAYTKLDSEKLILPNEEVHHLLHLCHLFFRPTFQHKAIVCQFLESSQMFRLGSAMQLYEAGVTFEAKPRSTPHSLLDITFCSSGKMTMPCLHVDDNTGSLLRNLIALEQMKYPRVGLDVSAYAVLLLHLVTTSEDVQLLRRYGIIQHHLASDKEMMYLINRLSVGLSFDYVGDEYSLKHLFHELKKYTERRRPRWKAWLKHSLIGNMIGNPDHIQICGSIGVQGHILMFPLPKIKVSLVCKIGLNFADLLFNKVNFPKARKVYNELVLKPNTNCIMIEKRHTRPY